MADRRALRFRLPMNFYWFKWIEEQFSVQDILNVEVGGRVL